jgi:hypothetical protein
MRIATFNVESFFERAKALNTENVRNVEAEGSNPFTSTRRSWSARCSADQEVLGQAGSVAARVDTR